MPVLATFEQTAVTTADTVVNGTLFAPPLSTTDPLTRYRIRFGNIVCTVTDGGTANRLYAVIRRVPAGYTAPSITISNAVSTFADVSNVLAYGLYSTTDSRDTIQWRWLKKSSIVNTGDSIIVQYVIDTSSTGQSVSCLVEYNVAAL